MCTDVKEKKPLVSVIMPAYNAARFIKEAISSVMTQTIADWELFVIDDCSKDNTFQIIQDLVATDARIYALRNEVNLGVAKTRNRGIALATGAYVALLDSDDYWYPDFLEKLLANAQEKQSDIIYCSYELVDEQNRKVCNDFIVPEATTFEESIIRSVITCSTVLFTSKVAQNYRFPTNMYHEDIALWFELLRDGKKATGVIDVLAAYRQSPNSRSSDKIRSACRRWKVYREHLKMPFLKCVVTMFKYGYYGLKKYKRTN